MRKTLILLLSLFSCRNENSITDDESKSIEIVVETTFDKNINLSEICSSISYLILEVSPDIIIGSLEKLLIHDNKLFILDSQNQRILVFDVNGKYIFQINKNGRGPGEYLNLEDFLVDSINSQIEILDDGNRKILTYDSNGNFLKERKFPFFADHFCNLAENRYAFFFNNYPNQQSDEDSYNVLILDSTNRITYSFLPIGELLKLKVGEQNCFQRYGKGVNLSIPFVNNIYYITENSSSIKYKINFTNFQMPDQILKEFSKIDPKDSQSKSQAFLNFIQQLNHGIYVASICNIFENHNYFTFQYHVSNKGTYTVILNKDTGKTHLGIPENNIDFGLYGTPLYMLNDTLFTYIPAFKLKERIKSIENSHLARNFQFEKLKQLADSFDEADNPIICKFLLK